MAKETKKRNKKPEPLWTARNGKYIVEGYDFQLHKISDPPAVDADPVVIPFKKSQRLTKN